MPHGSPSDGFVRHCEPTPGSTPPSPFLPRDGTSSHHSGQKKVCATNEKDSSFDGLPRVLERLWFARPLLCDTRLWFPTLNSVQQVHRLVLFRSPVLKQLITSSTRNFTSPDTRTKELGKDQEEQQHRDHNDTENVRNQLVDLAVNNGGSFVVSNDDGLWDMEMDIGEKSPSPSTPSSLVDSMSDEVPERREQEQCASPLPSIIIDNVGCVETVACFLRHLYTGEMKVPSCRCAVEGLDTARSCDDGTIGCSNNIEDRDAAERGDLARHDTFNRHVLDLLLLSSRFRVDALATFCQSVLESSSSSTPSPANSSSPALSSSLPHPLSSLTPVSSPTLRPRGHTSTAPPTSGTSPITHSSSSPSSPLSPGNSRQSLSLSTHLRRSAFCPISNDVVFVLDAPASPTMHKGARTSTPHNHVPASKALLSLRSPYFKTLFTGRWRESNQTHITIREVNVPLFRNLITVMYTDTVIIEGLSHALALLVLARYYQFSFLMELCDRYIAKSITTSNVTHIWNLSIPPSHGADDHGHDDEPPPWSPSSPSPCLPPIHLDPSSLQKPASPPCCGCRCYRCTDEEPDDTRSVLALLGPYASAVRGHGLCVVWLSEHIGSKARLFFVENFVSCCFTKHPGDKMWQVGDRRPSFSALHKCLLKSVLDTGSVNVTFDCMIKAITCWALDNRDDLGVLPAEEISSSVPLSALASTSHLSSSLPPLSTMTLPRRMTSSSRQQRDQPSQRASIGVAVDVVSSVLPRTTTKHDSSSDSAGTSSSLSTRNGDDATAGYLSPEDRAAVAEVIADLLPPCTLFTTGIKTMLFSPPPSFPAGPRSLPMRW